MKRNLIVIMAIVSIVSLTFGYYQKVRADKSESKAFECERIAIKMRNEVEAQMKLAEEQRKIAEYNAIEAMRQKQIAEEQVKRRGTK